MPTVQDIIVEYLNQRGYDGLRSDYYDCQCALHRRDSNGPCSNMRHDCEPGYVVPCDCDNSNVHPDDLCGFHISTHAIPKRLRQGDNR